MKMILSNETVIIGKWVMVEGDVVADKTCRRIAELIKNHLVKLGHDSSGWNTLYRDSSDGRFWELIYPQGELHGGGPPQLLCLSITEAKSKYSNAITP